MTPYALWILISAWLVCTGWLLSLFGFLGATGYLVSLLPFGFLIHALIRHGVLSIGRNLSLHWGKLAMRFRRPLPLIYLVYLLLGLVGGAVYPPSNYDALCYRLPRILHWYSEGQWHWIGAFNIRMDYSATGFEWLMAPLLIIFKTDRLLFLINVISYSLLPGLIYSVLVGFGIRRRVAWYWMWLLPTAYCLVLQAGSIGNDLFAAVYFLASAAFALRAARKFSWSDAALSMMAAGLMTGAKASNIPLLLPLAFPMLGMAKILTRKPWKSLILAVVACGVSFLPMAAMNLSHTGDWTGDPSNSEKMKITNPVAGLLGNTLQLGVGALAPPVFPTAKAWNVFSERVFAKEPLKNLRDQYPRVALSAGELAMEEGAGLGVGLLLLAVIGIAFSLANPAGMGFSQPAMTFGLLSCVALAAFMSKLGSESAARLASPYYAAVLIPLLALGSQGALARRRWWRVLASLCALSVLPAVLLNPSRPLIPADAVISFAKAIHAPETLVTRISRVYTVYGSRSDSLAVLRGSLPTGCRRIGFAGTGNESEYSLWKPLSLRNVVDLGAEPTPEAIKGVDCIVGSEEGIFSRFKLSSEDFARSIGGKVVCKESISLMAGKGPSEWCVIALIDKNPTLWAE